MYLISISIFTVFFKALKHVSVIVLTQQRDTASNLSLPKIAWKLHPAVFNSKIVCQGFGKPHALLLYVRQSDLPLSMRRGVLYLTVVH